MLALESRNWRIKLNVSLPISDVEVLSSEGLQELGGKDFDKKILEIISKKFKSATGKDFNTHDYGFTENDAEDLKKYAGD